jgi:Carboxypeptidase regulatory-like domain/TonB dependent receptor
VAAHGCHFLDLDEGVLFMKRLVLAILVVLSLAVVANAQTFRGAINGSVTDPSGASVPNAAVKATDTATGIEHNTATTSDGVFSFQDIPLGFYKVTVTATGFPVYTVDKVEVVAGTIYTLPVKLTLQQQATTVEVSAAALTLDTTTQTQTTTLTDTAVQDLPLNGRDFTQLISIQPGFGGYNIGGFGQINGTRGNQVNWQVDGTDNNDFWHNIPAINQGGVSGIAGIIMPIDAVDEFSAQTQSNAEAGRNAGGTVNLALKTGGNSLHGSAYYYNRNEFYAAKSPFFIASTQFPKAPPLRNENYGFSVGGPIIKNKTFFFLGFEKQQYIFGLTGKSTEPSAAWVANARAQLTNNGVPESAVSDSLFSALWPSSISGLTATPNNYFATVPGTGYSYNGVVKLDHNFNDKHHLSFHYFAGQGSQTQPPGASLALATASSNLGDYFEVAPIHVQNYSLVLNSVFTPKLTNQVLFGVSYFNQVFHDANNTFDPKALGLFLSPDATKNGQPIHGAPNIAITGFDQVGITPPEGRNDITGHLTDIVSYATGKHQFRFGGEIRQGRVNEFYFRRSLGSFTFDGSRGPWPVCNQTDPTQKLTCQDVNALSDFLAGNVSSSSIAVGNAERFVTVNGIDFFGQDQWQITRKLNLNLGLRYEYIGPLHSSKKDLAVFVPGKGLVIQGNGIDSIFPPDKNNFAPRIGFAYQPTARNDLVVRGGIGVFYDQINMNPFLDYRPPISGADGLQDNPIGPSPVDSYSRNTYNWGTGLGQAQAGGASIFPGVRKCSTLNVATQAATDNCGVPNLATGANLYNVYAVNQNFRTPYFFNYNLQVEKSFGSAIVWQIGYVGSQGRKLSVTTNANQNGSFNATFPNVGSIIQENSIGTSNYNSLQTTLKLRSWHGLTSQFAYTWAHSLDEMTEYRGQIPLDSFNLKQEYGNSDFDTRHNFSALWTYTVPGASWGPKLLTHGWQVSSVLVLHTGQPFNPAGQNASGTQRPGLDVIANPFAGVSHTFSAANGGEQWINPAAFVSAGTDPITGQPLPGNLSRNKFYGPNFKDVDLSVIKNIPITERVRVQLRAEMFNVFNRINLTSGAGSVGSSGIINDTIGDFNGAPGLGPGEPFNVQIAVKIIF